MAFSLFGKAFRFSQLFSEQRARLDEAATELDALLQDLGRERSRATRIRELERESHATFREISRELALTQIRPVERVDVHDLNMAFDLAVKSLAGVAARAALYGFKGSREAARSVASDLREMTQQLDAMIGRLRRGEPLTAEVTEVERLRGEADRFLLVGTGELYDDEEAARRDPIEVFRWTHLYARLEEAVDRMEHIAVVLEAIALKRD